MPEGTRGTPVRLSLNGLHGFYTLQTPDLPAAPMPTSDSRTNEEPGYRKPHDFGTSIAIRLDPRKESTPLNLHALLKAYLVCPPVRVALDGRLVGGAPILIESRWSSHRFLEIGGSEPFEYSLRIGICPIDITAPSAPSGVRGQGFVAYIASAAPAGTFFAHVAMDRTHLLISLNRAAVSDWLRHSYEPRYVPTTHQIKVPLSSFLSAPAAAFLMETDARLLLSHNGISVPREIARPINEDDRIWIYGPDVLNESDSVAAVILTLLDEPRPRLSISAAMLWKYLGRSTRRSTSP